MSGLVKNRLANALAQLAFGVFLLQSLHCCHAFQDVHAHPHPATLNGLSFVANAFPEKNDVLSAGNYARLSYRAAAPTCAESALQAEETESALANAPLDRLESPFDPSRYHSAESGDHDCCSSRSAQINYIPPRILDAAPEAPSNDGPPEVPYFQALEKTFVEKGKSVSIGAPLCVVSDLRELLIEGRAFESDEPLVNAALAEGRPVSAIFAHAEDAAPDAPREKVGPLVFRSISNRIDANSRAFSCYVELKNYLLDSAPRPKNDATSTSETAVDATDATSEVAKTCADAAPRLNWRFKPGQRCELAVETETLSNVFVVPVDATAQEGAETFLFEQDGTSDGKRIWRKRSVRVLHQTANEVVVANDGSIEPGAKIANHGAYQLYVALTNGGGKLQAACDCGEH